MAPTENFLGSYHPYIVNLLYFLADVNVIDVVNAVIVSVDFSDMFDTQKYVCNKNVGQR